MYVSEDTVERRTYMIRNRLGWLDLQSLSMLSSRLINKSAVCSGLRSSQVISQEIQEIGLLLRRTFIRTVGD